MWEQYEQRLEAEHYLGLAEAAQASPEHLSSQDLEFVRACKPVDNRFKSAYLAAFACEVTDVDAGTLKPQPPRL